MIAVIDYGVGNLFSLSSSLAYLGLENKVTRSARELDEASHIILPGVGAFGDAAEKLRAGGMSELVVNQARSGKPLLGICLGMQLLFDKSYEFGVHDGLGLIKGEVKPLAGYIPDTLKIPQMGWNSLKITQPDCPIFKYSRDGDFVYFVHSYYGCCENPSDMSASCEYGRDVTAAVWKDNVFGCQFHPEKSSEAGLRILKAFAEIN